MVLKDKNNKKSFGEYLLYYRQSSKDPLNESKLTQKRLAALLYNYDKKSLDHSGYLIDQLETEAWPITAQLRDVVIDMITVFMICGGMNTLEDANELLLSGGLPLLTQDEVRKVLLAKKKLVNTDVVQPTTIQQGRKCLELSAEDIKELNVIVKSKRTQVEYEIELSDFIQQILLLVQTEVSSVKKGKSYSQVKSKGLSPREKEVFDFITIKNGYAMSNSQIAKVLGIKTTTLRRYLRTLYGVFDVGGKAALHRYRIELESGRLPQGD